MKTAFLNKSVIICACLFASVLTMPVLAYWDEPTLLSELNDYNNGYAATRPTISADENIIFFVRTDSTGQDRGWEAHRNPQTGFFEDTRILSELPKGGASVYGTWISEDNQRLYHTSPNGSWSRRQIWMAIRYSPNQPWSDVRLHNELDVEAILESCSLTADEKHIMYMATPNTFPRQFKIYYASRNSIDDLFSTPEEVYELNAIGAIYPTITPDGLTVYFSLTNDDTGFTEIWIGSRTTLDEPFGNFVPIAEINAAGNLVAGWASPSWDGQRLYYLQRQGQPDDLDTKGIFVSHWVDPPQVAVEKKLTAAIIQKQEITEQLQAAIDMEIETLRILHTLQKMTDKDSDEFQSIQKTKIHIHKALRDEILAQMKIRDSIRDLEKALACYRMEDADTEEADVTVNVSEAAAAVKNSQNNNTQKDSSKR